MNVAVVGTGYVGLVTGTCFASLGNDVTCVDIDAEKVARMQHGEVPIYEPGLEEMFAAETKAGRLHFTTDLAAAVSGAQVVFLALPTPPGEDGSADLSYVLGVAGQLGPLLQQYTVVIDKSTVPVGTSEQVREKIAANAKQEFDVVSNPEFLREGFAVQDFLRPDRIVLGLTGKRAEDVMRELYRPITDDGYQLIIMDERSAELTKYAANSFLAMKITFMNEIANLCERVGADVDLVRQGVGSDDRIGPRFLYPGIGYGGSCFPKDVQALRHTSQQAGHEARLLSMVIDVNLSQQRRLQEKVIAYYDGNVEGKTFALWGLSFKPHTDDVRQAPALGVIKDLTAKGARVRAFDPAGADNARKLLQDTPNVDFADDQYAALDGADALLIATEWPEFAEAPLARIKQSLAAPVIFDGRNIFQPADMQKAGFYYESIGRPVVKPADS
jgi:UDPglucose 6-dehydrogenase